MEAEVFISQDGIEEQVASATASLVRCGELAAAAALEEWYVSAQSSPEELKYVALWAQFLEQQVSRKDIAA